jgi:hypothetical protein
MKTPCAAKVSETAFDIWRISSIAVTALSVAMKMEKSTTNRNLSECNNFMTVFIITAWK